MTNNEQVIKIIREYVEPKKHVLALERIHKYVFDEDVSFTGFDEAVREYRARNISDSDLRNFVSESKRVVEGGSAMISETYFNILEPDTLTLESVEDMLSSTQFDPNSRGEEREGFEYTRYDDKETIEGKYVYVDVSRELSYSGEPEQYVSEGAIDFEIVPEQNLLVLKSTGVIDVQKTKSIFRRKTEMDIGVAGDLTNLDAETTSQRIEDFKNSFGGDDADSNEVPIFLRVDDLRLHKPEEEGSDEESEVQLTAIDFEGRAISEHPQVIDRIEDGWRIKKMVSKVQYKEEIFEVTVAGTSMMGYGKVADFVSRPKGESLIADIREKYLEYIA